MLRGRRLGLALVFASLALLAFVVFGGSDEDKVLARLKEVARAVETRSDETNALCARRASTACSRSRSSRT